MPQFEILGFQFQYVLGVILIMVYAATMIDWTAFISSFSKLQAEELPTTDNFVPIKTDVDTVPSVPPVNSDKPAPKGTAEYIALVKSSAPDASDTLRLDYASRQLTEAQILREEVTRKLPPVPPAPKVKE